MIARRQEFEFGVVCGDDCSWKMWAAVWFFAFLVSSATLSIKLIDARHQLAKQEVKR